MTDILMPALSPTMEEGSLTKWHVKAGDTVSAGQVIAEIETDKATMEVEAVDEGEVAEILVAEGTEGVKVNTPIARLKGDGAPAAKAPAKTEAAAPKSSPPGGGGSERPGGGGAAVPASAASQPLPPKGEELMSAKAASGERIFASPLARRMAQQAGIDLKSLQGTGPGGRIVKADIEAAPKGGAKPAGAAPASAEPRKVLSLEQQGIPAGSYDLVPLDGMRKAIARRLTDSFRDVPHFPLEIDLEIDGLLAARSKVNAMLEKQGVKVSVNDFVIKAAANALKAVP